MRNFVYGNETLIMALRQYGFIFVVISDVNDVTPSPYANSANTLLPPSELLTNYYNDYDYEAFEEAYHSYLSTEEPLSVATIIAMGIIKRDHRIALIGGFDEMNDLNYIATLSKFMEQTFGLTGVSTEEFMGDYIMDISQFDKDDASETYLSTILERDNINSLIKESTSETNPYDELHTSNYDELKSICKRLGIFDEIKTLMNGQKFRNIPKNIIIDKIREVTK